MEYLLLCIKQVFTLSVIILAGIISYKKKLVTKEAGKCLSDILLLVVVPVFVFMSYQIEYSKELLKELGLAFVISVLSYILLIFLSYLFISKKNREYIIDRFSVVYANSGFMGIPLISGVFGQKGVIFGTVYLTAFYLFVWTHGLSMVKGSTSKKDILKMFLSPPIIGVVLGFLFYVLRIRIPEFVSTPLNYIGSMNTPLGMLVVGITIAQTKIINIVKNLRGIYVSLLRLVILPAITIFILSFIPCDSIMFMSIMLSMCCPTAAIVTLFCVKYEKNAVYASEIFAQTTILSAVTLPLMIMFMSLFR